MERPHYRAIILIFASNFPNDKMYREVWKKYMFRDPQFKVLFIYGKSSNILTDYNADYDMIAEHAPESIQIPKVLEAFKIIESRFTFNYLIRTNLSTFWDFEKLHLHLDVLPTQQCYSGDGPLPDYDGYGYYLSGCDTIVSNDLIYFINRDNHRVDTSPAYDDQSMGLYFHGVCGAPMLPNRICFFEDIEDTTSTECIQNRIGLAILHGKDHYRVKNNRTNREQLDLRVYNELLQKIYHVF
jgi:hypothetical protein